MTFEDLKSSVKGGTTSGYFHREWHDTDTQSIEDHVFDKFKTFANFAVKPDLPLRYRCYGKYSVCRAVFRTPFEAFTDHRVKCGSAELSLHNETMKRVAGVFSAYSAGYMDTLLNIVIKERQANPALGCGSYYYWCKDADEHALLNAKKCGCPYRECLGLMHVCKKAPKKASASPSLSPSEDDVYTAFAGGSHTANVSVPSGWKKE